MNFTENEIEAMRKQLAKSGIECLVRIVRDKFDFSRGEVYELLSKDLGIAYSTVTTLASRKPSKRLARKLAVFAKEHEIPLFVYSFLPTDEVCLFWLKHDYDTDRGKHITKWSFHHWDRDMSKVKLFEAA